MGKIARKYFWSDDVDHKDWLLLLSSSIFFLFVAIGLISILAGRPIDLMYVELLKMVSPVLMSIVAGVFGVNIATEIRKPKESESINTENTNEPKMKEKKYYDDEI